MKKRIFSSVLLVIILTVTLILGGYVLGGVLLIVSLVAYDEMQRAFEAKNTDEEKKKGLNLISMAGYPAVCVHYFFLMWMRDMGFFPYTIVFTLSFMLLIYVLRFPTYTSDMVFKSFFAFMYAPVMLSFILLLREEEHGVFFVWVPFVAWASDSFAYLAGINFGSRKLTPKLSPKKTVEGALGALIGSAVVGALYGLIMALAVTKDFGVIWEFAVIALVGSLLSQIGDLIASGIKREHGIKDYGKLIPGHGGITDRFDSIIFIAPVMYIMIKNIIINN